MRAFGLISLLITLSIIGYLMVKQETPGGEGLNANTAKQAELSAQHAADTAKLASVRSAVQTYQKTQEKWPANLEAVVEAGFLAQVPNGVVYSPETGEVSLAQP